MNRQLFGETDEWVARKTKALLDGGLCRSFVLVRHSKKEKQLDHGCRFPTTTRARCTSEDEVAKMVLAYEPIWAIGRTNASLEQAQGFMQACEVITRHSGSFVQIAYAFNMVAV